MTHSFPTRRASDLEAGPPGRARLVPARAEDVRHARALCVEYGVALLLDGMDQTNDELAGRPVLQVDPSGLRSEEHTSELQSLMRISYAVFCLKKQNHQQ